MSTYDAHTEVSMRFLLIVTIALGVTPPVVSSTAQTISSKEQEAIKATCAWRVQANGPADYYNCVAEKTQALQNTSRPDVSGINPSDLKVIESTCSWRWQANGPADYYQCVDSKAKQLRTTSEPDVSGIPSSDLEVIKSTCAWRRQANGPADYYQCVDSKAKQLRTTSEPDVSGIPSSDLEVIKSTCAWRRQAIGPADYYQCVDSKAKQLRATTSRPTGAGTIRSTPREQSLTEGQTNTSAVVPSNQSSSGNKRLRYFLGTWKLTGDVKRSLFGPAGKMTGIQRNEIAPDGMSVNSKWEEQRPTGRNSGQATYSYDLEQNVYRYHGSSDDGEVEDSAGLIEGNSWVWTSNLFTPSGAPAKGRFTLEVISPSAYRFKFEIALQGDAWMTVTEGNAEQSR